MVTAKNDRKSGRFSLGQSFYRIWLLTKFFKFVSHKLYLGTDNDLYCFLAWANHTCHTGRFDLFLIYLSVIPDLQTESRNAVIDAFYILFATNTFKHDSCHFGVIIILKLCAFLCIIIVIFTSRSL